MRHQYENYSDPESEEEESNPESEVEESDLESGGEEEESDSRSEDGVSNSKDYQIRSDEDLRTKIWLSLQKLETPSAFACSGINASLPNPIIYIPQQGVLGLPLSTKDAQKIISEASQSPFGKGEKTVIDTSVRKSWELNPNQFTFKNSQQWKKAMDKIVDIVVTELGVKKETGISAELHKLLLYEPGAFFKPHKDSEKAPGMFATLVVCLPSPHEGGKLVLSFDNREYKFETSVSSNNISYAAWFADVTHQVLPVMTGYRLMLTYNLIRKTNFEIPSYSLAHGHVQQLSTLLKQYSSLLKKGDDELPPILLHRLKHLYTETSLQLKSLKPQDLTQVEILKQVAAKLGFDVYLAMLELEIRTDEECTDFEERDVSLQKMIELDGKPVVECFDCPEGCLIDPTPQEAGEADEEEIEPTGNEGCPVTNWYRDTVVVLVPPSEKLDFVFQFSFSGKVIGPLFNKLMQEFSENPSKKPKLKELCKLALKQKPREHYPWDRDQSLEPIVPYFQKAAATALRVGFIDLFDDACKIRGDKIILDAADSLGRWVANKGVAAMSDRLMKGVRVAPSVAKKVEFLDTITKSFEATVQESGSAKKICLKQWSDNAILTAVAELSTLTKADGLSLGRLGESIDWSLFESKITPVILKATTVVKITFINELMSVMRQEPLKEQRAFLEMIIPNIWKEFVFESTEQGEDHLNKNDLIHCIENSIIILSLVFVEATIIPAMLSAVPKVSKDCAKELLISLVRMILKNELAGFKLLTNNAVPPPSHKHLVQAILIKYLKENVGCEPPAPKNWSLSVGSCTCNDCSVVNRFLQDPSEIRYNFPCAKPRRSHLHEKFTRTYRDNDYKGPFYDVVIIRGCSPLKWQITKHRRTYETALSEWKKNTKTAVQILSELKKDEPVDGRLEAYLQPYYNFIMNADVKKLLDLKSLVTSPGTSRNIAPTDNVPSGQKRGAGAVNLPTKRIR